eukprot:s614_g3.t1
MVEAIRMPATTAFMVKAAKELTGMEDFGVVAVTRAAQLKAHRDSHNEVNSENAVVALTTFQGGGVWIEEEGGDQWREVTGGGWIRGRVHDLLPGQPVVFNPRRWHEPQRAVGDRVVMMTYTPRTTKLTKSDWEQLRDLGFSIKLKAATEGDVSDLTPCISQQYVLTEDDVLESFPKDVAAEEETTALDGSLLRASEYQQQLLDDMLDRSSLLQDLLEEEEERMEDFRQVHQGSLESAKQVHGEVTSMVKAFAERTKYEHRAREECLLRAATVEDHQDYEQLLDSLQDDLQVTHTVPLQQVKPVADRWSKAIQKEILNLFNTGTLKKIKLTDAKKMEAQGLLRFPLCWWSGSRNVAKHFDYDLFEILEGGHYRHHISIYIQAEWPESMPMYAVVPPRLLQELNYSEEGEAWLVCRPLYGLRESPAIWSAHRNKRLRSLKIKNGNGYIVLQQSRSDPELWFAINQDGEEQARGTLVALIVTYVDDLFYFGPEGIVAELHTWVSQEWPCSELQWATAPEGVRYLGMEIFQRDDRGV